MPKLLVNQSPRPSLAQRTENHQPHVCALCAYKVLLNYSRYKCTYRSEVLHYLQDYFDWGWWVGRKRKELCADVLIGFVACASVPVSRGAKEGGGRKGTKGQSRPLAGCSMHDECATPNLACAAQVRSAQTQTLEMNRVCCTNRRNTA